MLRKTRSVEQTVANSASGSKLLPKRSGAAKGSSEILRLPTSQPSPEEERYRKLREGRTVLNREVMTEYFQLELSPYFLNKLFDIQKVDGDIDFACFERLVKVFESPSMLERQRVAFCMFDPNAQGRISKNDFKRAMLELLCGATKQFPVASSSSSGTQATLKPIVQAIADSVYSVYCTDEQRGMDMREWLNFAAEDVEVGRLVNALDRRILWNETVLRRRFLI